MSILFSRWTFRYAFIKISHVLECGHSAVKSLDQQGIKSGTQRAQEKIAASLAKALLAPLTQIIKFTGPAMAPTLNRNAAKQGSVGASEYLLTRKVVSPARHVRVGDVVCFKHPLGGTGDGLMVRRVAAIAGDTLDSETAQHVLAPDSVWLLADNTDLKPSEVEDSRSFGPVPVSNVIGRCIYAIRSRSDREHVQNHKASKQDDEEVVAVELTDDLLGQLEQSDQGHSTSHSDRS